MKTKTFIIKVLKLIAIILLFTTFLVLAIKNRHSSALIECQTHNSEATFTCELNVPLFLSYASFLAKYIIP